MYGYCFSDGFGLVSAKKLSAAKVAHYERLHGALREWGRV